ncbi:MAG TPA: histidine kinase dimerization/phospho-acceptor domain-containing protein, partial [Bacteroidales bacterium]|nr:histidine kinase dimerization/phospho-acceptor domain-containing protein [Bacteroidales bacterium]
MYIVSVLIFALIGPLAALPNSGIEPRLLSISYPQTSSFILLLSLFFVLLSVIGLLLMARNKSRVLSAMQEREQKLLDDIEVLKQETDIAQRTKQRFLANLSHEIRTPLNGIFGLTSQFRKEKLNEEQAEMLNDIELLTQHLHALVSDVLDFTKMETGILELDKVNFHLMNEIGPILSFYRKKCFESGIAFSSH